LAVAKLESEMAPHPTNGVLGKHALEEDELEEPRPPPPPPSASLLLSTADPFSTDLFAPPGDAAPSEDLSSMWTVGDELNESTIASLVGADSCVLAFLSLSSRADPSLHVQVLVVDCGATRGVDTAVPQRIGEVVASTLYAFLHFRRRVGKEESDAVLFPLRESAHRLM
jgi:hypothetical protein